MRLPSVDCRCATAFGDMFVGGLLFNLLDSSTAFDMPVTADDALPQLGSPVTPGVCLCDVPIIIYWFGWLSLNERS